jgi:hypothetical protein
MRILTTEDRESTEEGESKGYFVRIGIFTELFIIL